mmetsp:Transcript_25346/g.67029  ORF Transcript_25346/g.67029 Transcript_25346/m.67029 type:complete len:209 (-) Transcript_25346:2241-2867(-)
MECGMLVRALEPIGSLVPIPPVAELVGQNVEIVDHRYTELFGTRLQVDVLLVPQLAPLMACCVDLQRPGRHYLQGPVQAKFAVAEEHAVVEVTLRCVVRTQDGLEAVREENDIRMHFHDPVVLPEIPVADDLLPELREDAGVVRGLVRNPVGVHGDRRAMEVHAQQPGLGPAQVDHRVAVDRVPVALIDAFPLRLGNLQQEFFLGPRG